MTYGELLSVLHTMAKISPRKLLDEVVYVDRDGTVHGVSHTEYNDGSIHGMDSHQLLLSEV